MGEYSRRISVKVEIDIWDWSKGALVDTLDITNDILNYRFQKTIKTPKGTCQVSALPQSTDAHILDIISPMDVIRISEFGALKFVGYIQRVSYTGSISRDGKPVRTATITAGQFGGLLVDASIGMGLGTMMGKPDSNLRIAAKTLIVDVSNAVKDGVIFTELITVLIDSFKTYISSLSVDNFITYLNTYLDVESGLESSRKASMSPRSFELYTGTEQSFTFWQIAEQLVEKPFNEFWIDNGPRKVFIDGDNSVTLPDKSCFVFRETPFDGTVGGVSDRSFSSMRTIHIDRDHFLRFDLARSMDEVYSVYNVKLAAYKLDDVARLLLGIPVVDDTRIGKYLFKPLITELFYTRMEKTNDTSIEVSEGDLTSLGEDRASTLKAWFENNDQYLSGVLSMMVPSDSDLDPKIGDRVSVHGITGTFYAESIAHVWAYQGPLKSELTVTRGYNGNKRIELKDRLFRRNAIQ